VFPALYRKRLAGSGTSSAGMQQIRLLVAAGNTFAGVRYRDRWTGRFLCNSRCSFADHIGCAFPGTQRKNPAWPTSLLTLGQALRGVPGKPKIRNLVYIPFLSNPNGALSAPTSEHALRSHFAQYSISAAGVWKIREHHLLRKGIESQREVTGTFAARLAFGFKRTA
jgi:hypothetical protein